MTKICPSCGSKAVDDQSQFCNKCGNPFPPPESKKTVVMRTEPRLAEAAPPPPPSPLPAEPRRARAPSPVRRPSPQKTGRARSLPFTKFIARDRIKLIWYIGIIVIILVSILGISTGVSKAGTDAAVKSFANTTALVETPSASPLFWIGFLIFGSLIWRMLCEICVVLFAIHESLIGNRHAGSLEQDTTCGDEMPEYGTESDARCPVCGRMVPAEELRECSKCGIQGCNNCIRMSGLVRKKPICRDCFGRK